MLQTTSTERRAAGGDGPRSGGSVKMGPRALRKPENLLLDAVSR